MTKNISVTAIQSWLVEHIAELIGSDPASVDVEQPFESFGLASRDVVGLSGDLEDWLELRLSPTLLYQYPTIARLAHYLAGQLREDEEAAPPARQTAAAAALTPATPFDSRGEPIAIIGMACRFPGADSPEEFWQLLRDGTDAITEVPPSRFDVDAVFDPRPDAVGKLYTRWGGFLRNVDRFDPHFFGISPREAASMDPQQRLLLEVTWEALEAAGQRPADLVGSRTGVFVGISSNDYMALGMRNGDILRAINPYSGTGTAFSVAAGRIAYVLGLQGPCVAVDTACSSSLVAVHLAGQSLRTGECDLAVAGGVNVILSPEGTIYFCRLNVMAHDGRCKTFDARADGYVRSEGCGVVVLKRLSDAQRDGDPILAVIRGSAINQDGRSNGLTAPNPLAQQEVIRAALAAAHVAPKQIDYVETHGTGTELGDPIEVNALAAALGPGHTPDRPFVLGAVKANIGHTEAAAGVAGLIKVVLALQHGEIPPQPHVQRLNPLVDWAGIPAVVPTTPMPWARENGRSRLAGLSSFGFSGTNAHAVIEEAPPRPPSAPRRMPAAYVLPLSARSPEALRALAGQWADFLTRHESDPVALHDICYTASLRRSHLEHRLAVTGSDAASLAEQLRAFVQGEARPTLGSGRYLPGATGGPRAVFLFPGQGGQWPGMARGLLAAEPVFRQSMEACDAAIRRTGLADWSLLEQLAADADHTRLGDDIAVIQPTLWAIQVSLAALWRSWGVEPAAVVGHSLGEVAAACVAGALTLDEGARIICLRSKLMQRVSGRGAMAVVGLSVDEAEAALHGYEDRVTVAVSNGPRSTVISGDADAVDAVLAALAARDVFCRKVKVDVASHSPHMDPLRPELVAGLSGLSPRPTAVPMISTVTGEPIASEELTADYWGRNLRSPVRFWPAVQRLAETGHDVFLELSPHPVLLTAVREGLKAIGREAATLPSLRREEDEPTTILSSLAALHCLGYRVNWAALYPDGGQVVPLPPYPWQRERYWLEPAEGAAAGRAEGSRTGHPLLDVYVAPAVGSGLHVWETTLDLNSARHRYLADHRVQDVVMLPAAAYLEIAQAAARQALGAEGAPLEGITFGQALILPAEGQARLQVVITADGPDGNAAFQVFSSEATGDVTGSSAGDGRPPTTWTLHASGKIRRKPAVPPAQAETLAAIQARCPEAVSAAEHYAALAESKLQYGPAFQGLEQLWRGEQEALGQLHLPAADDAHGYVVHPALLDAAFQALAAALPRGAGGVNAGETWVPVAVERCDLSGWPGATTAWSHAVFRAEGVRQGDTLTGDITLLNDDGQVVGRIEGLRLQRLSLAARPAAVADWFLCVAWEAQPLPSAAPSPPADRPAAWLILADRSGLGDALAAHLATMRPDVRCVLVTPGAGYAVQGPHRYVVAPDRPEEIGRLLADALPAGASWQRVVYLWSLDAPSAGDLSLSLLRVIQALGSGDFSRPETTEVVTTKERTKERAPLGSGDFSRRLWIVTRGAQAVLPGERPAPEQAPLLGLARTAFHELSDLRPTVVDLSPVKDNGADPAAEIAALLAELLADSPESEVALRGDSRYVPRLVRWRPDDEGDGRRLRPFDPARDANFRLETREAGVLDNLTLRACPRTTPGPGQVEVRVRAAGLNFLDVLTALGLRPDLPPGPVVFGTEFSGEVVAVGPDVADLRPGDEVLGLAPAAFGAYTITRADLVGPKPAALSWEEAATIPIVFLTAHYALERLAHLERGERVLIHSATGGVGLAAVQLAQAIGAEIFATAGSPEKRDYLRALGVRHVMDSRSLAFADEVLALTGGEGVDVVLNALAGEAIAKGLSVLRPYGRFMEIGKRDIYSNAQIGLWPFHKNLAYFAVDLARVAVERPALIRHMLTALMARFATGELRPLPRTVVPVTQAPDAFRTMAQSRHIGKIVLSLDVHPAEVWVEDAGGLAVRPDSTYLITGGLGGLGLVTARWLVEQGARHLVLMGRGAPDAEAQAAIAALEDKGATVRVARADVADAGQVAAVLDEVRRSMPPLRGVFHLAGVLDDAILAQQTAERFAAVMAPKVQGAWNLHRLTTEAGDPLDCFVMFSSVASLLGSPGQGNYAAANAFMDSLAHYRQSLGLPALSVNWGPWAQVGLAARPDRAGRLELRGIESIYPEQGAQVLTRLAARLPGPQVAVLPLVPGQWRAAFPQAASWPLLQRLLAEEETTAQSEAAGPRAALLAATTSSDRRALLEAFFTQQLSQVLGASPKHFDAQTPLASLGLDSLMAVELKNRVETTLGLQLPIATLLRSPRVGELVEELLAQAEALAPTTAPSAVAGMAEAGGTETAVEPAAPGDRLPPAPLPRLTAAAEPPAPYEIPLSAGQAALWLQHQLNPGSVYSPAFTVRIRAAVDPDRLRDAFRVIAARHPVLRTTFPTKEGMPVQRVSAEAEPFLLVEDVSGLSEAELHRRLTQEANHVFDLERGPLWRVCLFRRAADDHVLMLHAHHIVMDLWSLALITSEFGALYRDPTAADRLPRPAVTYGDYVRWQEAFLKSPAAERMWAYWRAQLAGPLPVLELPTDRPRPAVQTYRGSIVSTSFSQALTAGIRRLAERLGVTPYVVLLAAFQALLHRYTGQDDLVVGSTTTGRTQAELANVVGYFVNPVPIRTVMGDGMTFAGLVREVQEAVLGALANQDFPFPTMVERLRPPRDPARPPIFQVMFTLQRSHLLYEAGLSQLALSRAGISVDLGGLPMEAVTLADRMSPFDLTMQVADSEAALGAAVEFNLDLFDPTTAERLLHHYRKLLESAVADAERAVATLPMLTEEEAQQVLAWSAGPDVPLRHRCIHHAFEAQVDRTPDATALYFDPGNGHPPVVLTYRELDGRANQVAHALRRRGIGLEDRVALCAERSPEMIIGILGVLKAGAAYIPLDPATPPARLATILEDASPAACLLQPGGQKLPAEEVRPLVERTTVLDLSDPASWADAPTHRPDVPVAGDNLAYIIYTSGSTGAPKGVMLQHAGLVNLVQAQVVGFDVTPQDRVYQFAAYTFDASLSEIFIALTAGAALHLARREVVLSPENLAAALRNQRITNITLPPTLLRLLDSDALPDLRTVISAGEACTADLVARWTQAPPGATFRSRRFLNAYGPTETTIGPTYHVACDGRGDPPALPATAAVPIGRPIHNIQTFILDRQMQPVPVGVPGELCIGGIGLARGYVGRPDLTAERFVPNPFASHEFEIRDSPFAIRYSPFANSRLYRTGDLARWLPDGAIEFIGRADYQVKIRGFRVELGEIEAALARHPQVKEVVVVAHKIGRRDGDGSTRPDVLDAQVVAYWVPAPGAEPSELDLRSFLKQTLPDYMVPTTFVKLEAFPLTTSGKIDRKALPVPVRKEASSAERALPQTQLERDLAAIWQQVLGVEKVGIHDNFFDLGGHSLLMAQAHSRLQELLGREVPIVELFQYPTISLLAQHLSQASGEDTTGAKTSTAVQQGKERAQQQREALRRQQARLTRRPG